MNMKTAISLLACLTLSGAAETRLQYLAEEDGEFTTALIFGNVNAAERLIRGGNGGMPGAQQDFCLPSRGRMLNKTFSRLSATAEYDPRTAGMNAQDLVLVGYGPGNIEEMLELLWAHGAPVECKSSHLVDALVGRSDFALATKLVERGAKIETQHGRSVLCSAIRALLFRPHLEKDILKFVAVVLGKTERGSPKLSHPLYLASESMDLGPAVGRVTEMLLQHGAPVTADMVNSWIVHHGFKNSPMANANMDVFIKSLPNPFVHFGEHGIARMIDSTVWLNHPEEREILYPREASKALHASLNEARTRKMGHPHSTEVMWSRAAESVAVVESIDGWDEVTAMIRGDDGKFRGEIEHTLGTPKDVKFIVDGHWTTSPDYAVVDDGHGGQSNRLW